MALTKNQWVDMVMEHLQDELKDFYPDHHVADTEKLFEAQIHVRLRLEIVFDCIRKGRVKK